MIRRSRWLLAASPLLAAALGCASPPASSDRCPPGIEAVLASPALLRAQADAALEKDDAELAYRYLTLIEALHPDGAESRELFPAAAKLFKRGYFRNRVAKPDSVFVNSEPAFMFHWLSHFFRDQDEFPQQQVDTLFVGMPISLYDEFAFYAKARPKHFARWEMRVTEDNGRIETFTAAPARRPGRDVSATGR